MGISCFVDLKFGLGSFKDIVKFSGKHNVAPCLQFASHKSLLAIELAACKIHKDIICKDDCDISLGCGFSFVYSPGLLRIDGPDGGLPILRDFELEDAVGLLYEVLPFFFAGLCETRLEVSDEFGRLEAWNFDFVRHVY